MNPSIHKLGLDRCPRCDYSLEGLPDHHVCPECGLKYDKSMETYGRSNRWLRLAAVVVLLGNCIWIGFGTALLYQATPVRAILCSAFFLALTLLFVWQAFTWPPRMTALLWQGGIALVGHQRTPEYFTWDRIGAVTLSKVNGRIRLVSPGGITLASVPYEFFGRYRNADNN